jgi:ABC-2 type transport system ATP-binding protein
VSRADAIAVRGLVKDFGRTRALTGLDLTVRPGEVHGFLGPNGSGKSTTIRILLGLLRASAGSALVLGGDPWTDPETLHRRIAYVPSEVTLWPQLTGGEVIDLLGRLRGGTDPARRAEMLQRFELDPTMRSTAYSRGNRQKVPLVAALASDAELLILDEPTSGLDPLMEEVFAECIREARGRGRTVLLSSHILSEVENLCDRVTIIRRGRTIDSGTLAGLRHLSASFVDVTLATPPPVLDGVAGVSRVQIDGDRLRCEVETERVGELLGLLAPHGITSLTCQPPTLESLFLRHYGPGARPVVPPASSRVPA